MIYQVKEKFWWWDSYYTILDEKGNNIVYTLHRKWLAMDHAIEMKDEQYQEEDNTKVQVGEGGNGAEETEKEDVTTCITRTRTNSPTTTTAQTVLTIRKQILNLASSSPVYEVVRNDHVVVARIRSKRVQWFQQQRHVFEMADVEYVVEESKWKSNNKNSRSFSIQPTKTKAKIAKQEEIASVAYHPKRFWDLAPGSGSAHWLVNVKVDPTYYEGEALKDMCATVLAACIIMIEILTEHDRQQEQLIIQQQQQKERERKRQQQQQQQLREKNRQSTTNQNSQLAGGG